MKKSISLALFLGHDLSNAALNIFYRVSQASVIIRLLKIYIFLISTNLFFRVGVRLIIFDELIVRCTSSCVHLRYVF